jgi:hypothetical protein
MTMMNLFMILFVIHVQTMKVGSCDNGMALHQVADGGDILI